MNRKVLFVDDEKNILDSFKRQLRNDFEISTSDNPVDALDMIRKSPQFAVVVADYNMPGMDGITFLQKLSQISYETVRVLLTGNADLDLAVRAVNECNVYRFLTKPCETEGIKKVIYESITQYGLNTLMSEYVKPIEKNGELISVCSKCNKVKFPFEDSFATESWKRFELFFSKNFGYRFTHGLCPNCVEEMYSELRERKRKKED